jgi:ADP-ribose pyrophosphatase
MTSPTVDDRRRIDISPWFAVLEVVVRDREGATSVWHYQDHPGAVVVVAVLAGNRIAVVREWRPAVGARCVELPSGRVDAGESPEQAAARELFEETGLTAGALVPLGRVYNSPGSSNEVTHMFFTAVAAAAPVSKSLEVEAFVDEVSDATSLLAVELARRGKLLPA